MSDATATSSRNSPDVVKSARFWKEDGDFVLIAKNEAFKVHFDRVSTPKIRGLPLESTSYSQFGPRAVKLPEVIAPADLAVFLDHLYAETDTYAFTRPDECERLISLIRVSSHDQLDDAPSQTFARSQLEHLLEPNAVGTLDEMHIDHAEEILGVVSQYNINNLRKRLLYTVATTSHFDDGPSSHPSLPTSITTLCASLQSNLIAHFTPILFTVATASHMACTDVFAEKWMPLVIGPALADNGLCRPVETLRAIQGIEWEKEGLCEACCEEKRREWEGEIKTVWEKVDEWI